MFSCDYNGWIDVPEEEREAVDAFEAAGKAPDPPKPAPTPTPIQPVLAQRKAA